ncbi:unnamed protein product, partial [Ixodes pacificus]
VNWTKLYGGRWSSSTSRSRVGPPASTSGSPRHWRSADSWGRRTCGKPCSCTRRPCGCTVCAGSCARWTTCLGGSGRTTMWHFSAMPTSRRRTTSRRCWTPLRSRLQRSTSSRSLLQTSHSTKSRTCFMDW